MEDAGTGALKTTLLYAGNPGTCIVCKHIQHELIKQSAKVQSKNTKQRHEGRTQKQRHNTKTQSKDTKQKHKIKYTKQETLQPNRRPNIPVQHKLIKQSAKSQENKSTKSKHKAEAQSKSTKQEQQEKTQRKNKKRQAVCANEPNRRPSC